MKKYTQEIIDSEKKYPQEERMLYHYNCAETLLMAADRKYGLGIPEEYVKLVLPYGGGMNTGHTCGALLGAVAALGAKKMGRRAQETYGFNKECGDLAREFQAKLGDTNCAVLRKMHADQTNRCLKTVLAACDVLESHMAAAEQE